MSASVPHREQDLGSRGERAALGIRSAIWRELILGGHAPVNICARAHSSFASCIFFFSLALAYIYMLRLLNLRREVKLWCLGASWRGAIFQILDFRVRTSLCGRATCLLVFAGSHSIQPWLL